MNSCPVGRSIFSLFPKIKHSAHNLSSHHIQIIYWSNWFFISTHNFRCDSHSDIPYTQPQATPQQPLNRLAAQHTMANTPSVLFVCVHNAGRSQMAAGYLSHLAGDTIEVRSAGSVPADSINPIVVEAMLEEGIDISNQKPKILTPTAVQTSDVVITMGCGDVCPFFAGKRYLDWQLNDPAGEGIDAVRVIRDEIRYCVESLVAEIRLQSSMV